MQYPCTDQQLAHLLLWLRTHIPAWVDLHADSRALRPGDAFISYPVNGADRRPYIHDAVKRGAGAVLWDPEGWSNGKNGLAVSAFASTSTSTKAVLAVPGLAALAGPLASAWYGSPSNALWIIGITGTNGKTSCSYWIAQVLCALNMPCAVIGTLGYGLPGELVSTGFTTPDALQLQRCLAKSHRAGLKAVAMEVSSHALDQGRVNGVAFDIAVFTNLTQDHLDYHKTFSAYEAAKSRLFSWPTLRCAVINYDDPVGQRLIAETSGKLRTIVYGIGLMPSPSLSVAHCTCTLGAIAIRATATGTAFTLVSDWGQVELEVALLGTFNVSNLLAVLGVLLAADIPLDEALAQLRQLKSVNGRMQWLRSAAAAQDEPLVVVDYAHTPDALEKTLHALRSVATSRGGVLICVFGCGGDRDENKRPQMGAIAEQLADVVVLTSDNPRSESPAAIIDHIACGMLNPSRARRLEDRADAILQTIHSAGCKDVILIAGRGHETTQEIRGKKHSFCDQAQAQLALMARHTAWLPDTDRILPAQSG